MKIVKVLLVSLLIGTNTNLKAEQGNEKLADVEVYRSPTCGCCSKWIKHLENKGFNIKDYVTNDVQSVKDKYGVSKDLASCHTAIVNGYVIEGHVPAADIVSLLKRKPAVIGLSVPGMPMGTPGMEMGNRKDAYDVISFDKENNKAVFKHYEGN